MFGLKVMNGIEPIKNLELPLLVANCLRQLVSTEEGLLRFWRSITFECEEGLGEGHLEIEFEAASIRLVSQVIDAL